MKQINPTILLFILLFFLIACSVNYAVHVNMNGTAHVAYTIDIGNEGLDSSLTLSTNDSLLLESSELSMREYYASDLITNFEFDSNEKHLIQIEFDILYIDSLSNYLSIFGEYSIQFKYTEKKFTITGSEITSNGWFDAGGTMNLAKFRMEFTFDRKIKKLKTKNKSTRQEGNKIIIESTLGELNFKGKENQIEVLFK